MGKNRDLSSEIVAQIFILSEDNLRQRTIAQRLGIAQSAVCRALKRYQETSDFRARKRTRRRRCATARTDNMIRSIAAASPTATSSFIEAQLPTPVSKATIKRRLHDDFGLKAYRPFNKPMLSRKNIKDHVAFCKRHQG